MGEFEATKRLFGVFALDIIRVIPTRRVGGGLSQRRRVEWISETARSGFGGMFAQTFLKEK